MKQPLLQVDSVSKTFKTGDSIVHALESVSLEVMQGECVAIVGESGSGKSTLANLILGVYGADGGSMTFKGEVLPIRRTKHHRRAMQLVQQNPLSSLNPKRRIAASLRLALDVHGIGTRRERTEIISRLLEEVQLPADFATRSPSALSGGQLQRVAIARALACRPELVVLDEPTSALDVLVQARVLKLLDTLRARHNLTYLFITHDLSVVRNIADRVLVFESGRIVEAGKCRVIFSKPAHGYTRKLVSAVPVITDAEANLRDKLANA